MVIIGVQNRIPWSDLTFLRALALKNANAIFKPFLTFYGSKCAASKDAKHRNCKSFYNSATVQF